MKKLSFILVILLASLSMSSFGQFGLVNRVKTASGDLTSLKGATELNIEFSYDKMMVGTENEPEYITRRVGEMNKMKPGSGDEWKKKWNDDKGIRYEPNFLKYFTKAMLKMKIAAGTGKASAKYTLIITTEKIEPGLQTGISYAAKDCFLDIRATLIETANPDNKLCVITGGYIKGSESFDVGARITYAYGNWGKLLGMNMASQLKKLSK